MKMINKISSKHINFLENRIWPCALWAINEWSMTIRRYLTGYSILPGAFHPEVEV